VARSTVVRALLADLVSRGLSAEDGLLVVIDGAKALAAAVTEVFGTKAAVQRCTLHKRRNVADHLPEKEKAWADAKLVKAFNHPDPELGLRNCGSEMARHATITATGLPVFFAHPHSPWERGSNENLNRILREFFPKGIHITNDPNYLAAVAAEINDRPRRIHHWKKPSEVFTELIDQHASTA